ncbi:MAG TPA: hypothetical protein VEY95_06715 [Azospirillaceae bacterium]|nr:hypothetical protein [Azospirillaceae bacterium]
MSTTLSNIALDIVLAKRLRKLSLTLWRLEAYNAADNLAKAADTVEERIITGLNELRPNWLGWPATGSATATGSD